MEPRQVTSTVMAPTQVTETVMVPQQVTKTIMQPRQVTSTLLEPRQVTSTVMQPRQVTTTVMKAIQEIQSQSITVQRPIQHAIRQQVQVPQVIQGQTVHEYEEIVQVERPRVLQRVVEEVVGGGIRGSVTSAVRNVGSYVTGAASGAPVYPAPLYSTYSPASAGAYPSYPPGTVWGPPAGPPAAPNYTSIQYIAFEICTMPMGFDTQDTARDDWYPGLDSPDADLAARVGVIARALARLDGHPSVSPSPSCLKLLMMPEFFFRGKKGAYSVGEILGDHRDAGSLSSQLASLVLDPKWADWLFVFGTVVGYKDAARGPPAAGEPAAAYDVYNVALVQPGGCRTVREAVARAVNVVKVHKSRIDFLQHPAGSRALADGDCRAAFHRDDAPDVLGAGAGGGLSIDDDGVFVVHGIVFGLEICLDHACQRLRTQSRPKPGRADSVARIQVQLVPAGGMDLQPGSLCARPGRDQLAFLCDGLTNGRKGPAAGYGAHSDAIRLPPGAGAAEARPPAHVPAVSVAAVFNAGDSALAGLGRLFNTTVRFAPTLRFYPEMPLPSASPIV
jgi:hypothetical protein